MADEKGFRLFGFEIKRSEKEDPKKLPSIVPPRDDDGAGYATASGSHFGQYINLDDDSKDNNQFGESILQRSPEGVILFCI